MKPDQRQFFVSPKNGIDISCSTLKPDQRHFFVTQKKIKVFNHEKKIKAFNHEKKIKVSYQSS